MHRLFAIRWLRMPVFAVIAAFVLFASTSAGHPAEARSVWCSGDPTILVNGNPVSVTVHVPADRLKDLEYVEVVFHVPSNANVLLLLNDSLLFPAKTSYVKDQPANYGLLGTKIPVEIRIHNRGAAMPFAATTIVLGNGLSLWTDGKPGQTLWVVTSSLLNLRLF